jgi:hypothetical protein
MILGHTYAAHPPPHLGGYGFQTRSYQKHEFLKGRRRFHYDHFNNFLLRLLLRLLLLSRSRCKSKRRPPSDSVSCAPATRTPWEKPISS